MYLTIKEILEINKKRNFGYDNEGNIRPFSSEEFYNISCEMGLNQDNPEYRKLFDNFAAWISRNLKVRSGLEIGSGPGYLLNCLNQIGIETNGVDGNTFSQQYFKEKHLKYANYYHLDPLFEKNYSEADVLIAVEVFEHIDDAGLASIFRKISEEVRPKFIVFSSTPFADPNPGWDSQWGHINIKPTEDWDRLFLQHGFAKSSKRPPITEWARLYIDASLLGERTYSKLL